jgi:hypothetical protein
MRLNPDIIFIEKNISKELLRYFIDQKICVINGLKAKEIGRIAELSGIKNTIKNVLTTDRYEKERFLGELDAMSTLVKPTFRENLIYLEKDTGIYTLVLTEREESHLAVKKAVHAMLKFFRMIHLEKYLIYVDADMWQEKSCIERGRLYKLNLKYKEMAEKLKPFSLVFYKVELREMKTAGL